MATLTFLGAAQEVTGSCHLLETQAGGRILLDCGMHQGGDAVQRIQDERFDFDPADIDIVVLSHAHLDHSGLLPKLFHEGFSGPVICTQATAELLVVMLNDSVGLYLRDLELIGATICPPQIFKNLVGYIERDEIRPLVARIFPLHDIRQAQEAFIRKQHVGNFVITI